jgi:hypothetical protein
VWCSAEMRGHPRSGPIPVPNLPQAASSARLLRTVDRVGQSPRSGGCFSRAGIRRPSSAFRRPTVLVAHRLSGTQPCKVRDTTQDRDLRAERYDVAIAQRASFIGRRERFGE